MNFGSSSSDPRQIASAMRKMNEDPLFHIRKEEAKHHKNLLENPLVRERMKQLLKAEKEKESRMMKEEGDPPTFNGGRSHRRSVGEREQSDGRVRHRRRSYSRSVTPDRYRHSRHERYQRSRSRSGDHRRRSRSPDRHRRRPEDHRYDKRR